MRVPSEENLQGLVIPDIQDVEELSQPEHDSLYNLAGYCVHSIRKNQKMCDDCTSQVIVAEGEEVNQAAELTLLK